MKAAVIGLGPHGHRVLKALFGLAEVTVAGVVDHRADVLADPKIPSKIARHQSVEGLFLATPIDLVCVATNGPSHAALVVKATELGAKFVMVEKPMACSPAECDRMRAVAEKHGARLGVDHPRRYTPAYRYVRERVLSGVWGRPRSIWIQRPGIGLGCLGTHSFDLARFVTGREVLSVSAWVDRTMTPNPRGSEFVDPGGLVVLDMQDEVRAVIAQIEDGAGPMSVEIDLAGGRVRIDEQSGELEVVTRDLAVRKGPNQPASYTRRINPDGVSMKRDLSQEIGMLLAELIGGGPLDSNADQGTVSIEVLVAAYLSHRERHRPISLPLSAEQRQISLPVT